MLHEAIKDLVFPLETWSDVKNYFKHHKHVLTYMSQYKDFENFYGSKYKDGKDGRVFKIKGQDKILKVTTSEIEIEKAKSLSGKKFVNLINLYDIIVIQPELALIEAEFLYSPTGEVLRAANQYHLIADYFMNDGDETYISTLPNKVRREIINSYYEVLKAKIDPITVDIWKLNIMQDKQGRFKLIDL